MLVRARARVCVCVHLEMAECPFGVFVTLSLTTGLVKSFFSKYGHVAYQIKGNEMFDNIQAKLLRL